MYIFYFVVSVMVPTTVISRYQNNNKNNLNLVLKTILC